MNALQPILHAGIYVFCSLAEVDTSLIEKATMWFKESEGITIIVDKESADAHQLKYTYLAAWITVGITTTLNMVGLTALFSSALAKHGISCNVVAAFYHDHIFVDVKDAVRAVDILSNLSFQDI
jgi:hypothetical protein